MINTIQTQNPTVLGSNATSSGGYAPVDPTLVPNLNENKEAIKKFSKTPQRKSNRKYLIAGIILLLLTIGGGISLYLIKVNQDLRQQASEGGYNVGGGCSDASAASCQGKDPGDSCNGGTCRSLPNQIGNDGKAKCSCQSNEPNPTATTAPTTPPTGAPTTPPTGVPTTVPTIPLTGDPQPTTEPTAEPTTVPTTAENNNNNDGGSSSSSSSSSSSNVTVNLNNKTTGTASQPSLPQQLPKTGPEDWLKYLQVGLGALGAGALLLLFL